MNNEGWEKAERGPSWTATRDNPLTLTLGTKQFRCWAGHHQAKGVPFWYVEFEGQQEALVPAGADDTLPWLKRELALWWASRD